MDIHLSPEVLAGLDKAKSEAQHRSARLRIQVDGEIYPVLRSWPSGFSLKAEDAPHLRGTVEFCDGARVLHECLIVCSALEGREMVYEYKRLTPAVDKRPLDFVQAPDAPVALIE